MSRMHTNRHHEGLRPCVSSYKGSLSKGRAPLPGTKATLMSLCALSQADNLTKIPPQDKDIRLVDLNFCLPVDTKP
eukprot:1136182-Pelagomonas_calceolata.AAC.2